MSSVTCELFFVSFYSVHRLNGYTNLKARFAWNPWGYFILSVKPRFYFSKGLKWSLGFPSARNVLSDSDTPSRNILGICSPLLLPITTVQNYSLSLVEVYSRQAWFPVDLHLSITQLDIGWVTDGSASRKALCPVSWSLLWHGLNLTDSITAHLRTVLSLIPLGIAHLLSCHSADINLPVGKAARYYEHFQQICYSLSVVGVPTEEPHTYQV